MATERQKAVVELRAKGMTQKAIAAELGISQPAVSVILRQGERRGRGDRVRGVIKRPPLNTAQGASGIPIPAVADSVITEARRGTWERFKNPILEHLAGEYEGVRGAILRMPRGNSLDDALGEKWGGKDKTVGGRVVRRSEDDPARAYGYGDRMRDVIEQGRAILGWSARDPEHIPTECGCLPSDLRRSPCPGHMIR
jgi:Homeodomain-like domain